MPRKPRALVLALLLLSPMTAAADEIWVAPTLQADLGGMGVGSNVVWPVTLYGGVRFALAIPNDLDTFTTAKVVLIPKAAAAASTLIVYVCRGQNAGPASSCVGPFQHAFVGVKDQFVEVDISASVSPEVGLPGSGYLAVLAYSTPTTYTDQVVGMRFAYDPTATFTGTQVINAGNLDLDSSTAGAGNLTKNGNRFLHNFGEANTFLGQAAGNFSMTGGGNTAVGFEVLGSATTGGGNTGVGLYALRNNTTGEANTATGSSALLSNSTGIRNTASGAGALYRNTVGFLNTAAGYFSLFDNVDGESNTGIGAEALHSNVSGSLNTAVGVSALANNESGSKNTAVGAGALGQNIDGFDNTAVGEWALLAATGSRNVAIGNRAGYNSTSGSYNIYLGQNVEGVAGESFTMHLGKQGLQTKTIIAGIRGITTGLANATPVVIDSAGQLGTISSSRRFKEDIKDMGDASRALFSLRPVTFRYSEAYQDGEKPVQYGLVAEEVAEVFPALAVKNAEGGVDTVHYEKLGVLLLNELQKQRLTIEEQQRRIERLEQLLEKQTP